MGKRILCLFIGLCSLALLGSAQDVVTRTRTQAWPQEVLDAAARIPVQDGGRVKPLGSMANFLMLSINGKRSLKTEWDEKLDPVAWLLDCMFFPEQAMHYRCIQVVDYRIIESIGVPRRSDKRSDRYSILEILPGSEQLQQQTSVYVRKERTERTALEGQILNLGHNMRRMLFLTSFFDFARPEFDLSKMPEFESAFPEDAFISSLDLLSELEGVRNEIMRNGAAPSPAINDALDQAQRQLEAAAFVHLIPPSDPSEEVYMAPSDVIEAVLVEGTSMPKEMAVVQQFPALVAARGDMQKLGAGIIQLESQLQGMAEARGEFAKIQEEVAYYEHDWFYRAQVVFWLAFLGCLASWFFGRTSKTWKALYAGSVVLVIAGEGLVISGIVARCMLKERPPVTTVYEAILFIFAAIVLMSLFIEWIKRNSLALTMAALLGGVGMYVGGWNVETEAADTISPLVAVLNTNFWLSIHVPTITLGYAAGMLAAVFGHVFLAGKLVDVIRRNAGKSGVSKAFFGDVTRMTYGVLCFGALTATVGTILGGVWANDSWGRFWGWDPKENGALILCLGYLILLHGRMGGYLKQYGLAMGSVALGNLVLWAFWGVNLLQVGFHSYGFDATKERITNLYYTVEWGIVGLGAVLWMVDRMLSKRPVTKT